MRDLASVAVFLTVVEKGSFTAAAFHLNQSPSAVSKHIVRLEQELGAKLINRSTHHLYLTETGQLFLPKARQLLNDVDSIREELRSVRDDFLGTLRIHLTPGAGKRIALPLIYEFSHQHPSIKLDLTVSPNAVDILSEGYDLAIRSGRGDFDSHLSQSSIEALKLCGAEYKIAAAPAYFKRAGKPSEPRELMKHRCIIYKGQPEPMNWWFRENGKRYPVAVESYISSNDWNAIYDAVVSGLGIARLLSPNVLDNASGRGKITYIFSDLTDGDRGIWAFYPHMKPLPKKTKALLAHFSKRLS